MIFNKEYSNDKVIQEVSADQEVAGYENNSDIMTDYFQYSTTVKNKYNGTYSGLILK